jgi:hypothetical protein
MSKHGTIYDYGLRKVWPAHARMMVQPNQRELVDYYSSK